MKRYLVPAALLLLAACAQLPTPESPTQLEPTTFGTSGYENASGLAPPTGGAYVVGSTSGALHGAALGNSDAFLRKYNASGALVWREQFGTPEYDYAEGSSRTARAALAWWVRGGLELRQLGRGARRLGCGALLWTRQFGSSTFDTAAGVAVSGSNTLYVVGWTLGNIVGSNGSYDGFICKYTASGSVAWTRQLHFSSYDYGSYDYGSSVYLAGSYYFNNSSDLDARIIKYSTSGSAGWSVSFGPSGTDYVNDVTADGSGVAFAGSTYTSFAGTNQGGGDGYKRNNSGAYLWGKQLGTSACDEVQAVLLRGGEYAAGTTGVLGSVNSGGSDAFIATPSCGNCGTRTVRPSGPTNRTV